MKAVFYGIAVLGGLVAYEAIKGLQSPAAMAAAPAATPPSATTGVTAPGGSIEGILEQAGFSGQGLAVALGIVQRESGGNPAAVGYNPQTLVNGINLGPSVDRGLFQFNSIVPPVPVTDACAYDPLCSAKAAFAATNGGQNWGAWSTAP